MKYITLFLAILCSTVIFSQEVKKDNPITIYGFIRNEMFVDTYKGVNSASDQFYLVPNFDGKTDANGNDVNNQLSYNLTSMATRIGVRVAGPEIAGAKTSANIEGDFCGTLTPDYVALFRVRQANCLLTWKNSSLLVGQAWHPMWAGKVFPTVGGLATGAPFQPFNRSPLIRFDYKLGSVMLTGAFVSEFQHRSYGPDVTARGDQYARNSALPEVFASVEYDHGGFTAGIGVSFKSLKPYLTLTDTVTKNSYNCNTLLTSFVGMGYVQYSKGLFLIRAKSVLGQNTSYLTMPGGYAVSSYNKNGIPSISYTNYNTTTTFVNALYGKTWQVGLFLGYQKNLGTANSVYNESSVFGLLPKIQSMYRVAPSISYNFSKIRLVAEYEKTMAEYGTGGFRASDGLYNQKKKTFNHRALATMTYFF